ncbi:MAG: anti-sigma factor [Gemmatimonadaceae bacterium]
MTHEAVREALEALALDALDASERDGVMAHVADCVTCQAELAALETTVGELAFAARPLAMAPGQRDRVRFRLVARAAADRDAASAPPLHVEPRREEREPASRAANVTPIGAAPTVRRRMSGSVWLAMAASVIAVLGIGAFLNARAERDSLREAVQLAATERGARAAAMDSLRASLGDKDRTIANLTGENVAMMTLTSTMPEAPTGRMFWDQAHDAWTFVGHRLPAPKPGRTYQLWLVTPTAKISAGTFAPSANGEVMMRATYALAKDSLAAVAVTDEPGAGSAQPTTTPFLVASK